MTTVLEPIVVEEAVVPEATLADRYDLAASLIEEYGWVQGQLGSRDIGFCLIGAINATYSRRPTEFTMVMMGGVLCRNQYLPIVLATGGFPFGGANWNDQPVRTKEEVIDKLHEVAKELRRNGNTYTTGS